MTRSRSACGCLGLAAALVCLLGQVVAQAGEAGPAGQVALRVLPREAARGAFLNVVGVPFPPGSRLGSLRLVAGDGADVPLQYRADVRHSDGSPRWVHLAFVTRRDVEKYRLEWTPTQGQGRDVTVTRLKVSEADERIVVDTGSARFVLSARAFTPFIKVTHSKRAVLRARPPGGLSLQGRYFSTKAVATIEERGPVRAQIAYRGRLVDEAGVESCSFSARLHFAAGQPWVQIDVTLYQDTEDVFLDLSEFALNLGLPDPRSAVFCPNAGPAVVVASPGAKFVQAGKRLVSDRWSYPWTLRSDGADMARGERGRGAAIVRLGSGAAVELAVQDFWQNGPKSLEVSPDGVRVGLYPMTGEALALHVGMAKTHRVFLNFMARPAKVLSASAEAFLAKARAFPQPQWYSACGAPVRMVPRHAQRFQGLERLIDAALEQRFVLQREAYGEYGWLDFGDFRLGMYEGYWNNNETLLDHGLFVQFARTGDKRCFDWGEETLRHYQDVDLRHHLPAKAFDYGIMMGPGVDREQARAWGLKTKPERKKRFIYFSSSLSRYAPFVHGFYHYGRKQVGLSQGKYYCGGSLNQGHCFMLGHLTYYYMTGDRHALEMARRVGDALVEKFRSGTVNRATGMPALFLLELYAATGDTRYRDRAAEAVRFWLDHPDDHPDYLYVVTRCLARYAQLTAHPRVRASFLAKLDGYIRRHYVASDGLRKGVIDAVQRHADSRYYTQLADLTDASAFTRDPEYVRRGVATLETLVENHCFDSTCLFSAPPFLAACAKLGLTGRVAKLPHRLTLRFPDKKVLYVSKDPARPLEVRLYSDTGFRTKAGAIEGKIALFAPDGSPVTQRPVTQSGFHAHVIALDAAKPAGTYRIEVTGRVAQSGKKLLWDAWTSNGKLVVEITKGFLTVSQSSVYFQVPEGCRRFQIRLRPMLSTRHFTVACHLYDPAGRLHLTRIHPGNSNTPRTIEVDPVPPGSHGLWRLRLPFGKNYVEFQGVPPFYAVTPGAYFLPTPRPLGSPR